uniref:TM7S3/TM198-like domain-containing protein n=1 Tax=Anabas testudineus TaxID=64144 RepID=A0A3Q1HIU7_ANATE
MFLCFSLHVYWVVYNHVIYGHKSHFSLSLSLSVTDRVIFLPGTFQNVSVSQNETVQVEVFGIPSEVAFITLQFHTQYRNATLSYARVPSLGLALTAADSGLLSALQPGQTSLSLFLSSPGADPVTGTGVILPYSSTDPVPGACNIESNLDIDPNVYIHYNIYETTVRFAPANLGYERGETPPVCDESTGSSTRWRLQYDVYQYFLPENDLSERSLFSGFQVVADIQGIMENGKRVMTLSSTDVTTAVFNSIPGQGVIYTVIVRDPLLNTSASYVPVHTYACSFASTLDGCETLGKISTKVFFTIAGLAGLFCDFFRLTLSEVIGVLGGVILVMSWWRFGSVMACVIVVGLMLGFLIASTVLFTPLGDLDVFRRSDVVFWLTFSCITIIVPLFFVRWPREGNITTCGIVGAYAVVLAVNAYIYTSLSYITLNILKRFLNTNFSAMFTDVPFQTIDYVMITVWVVLGASGIALQLYRERSRPFFPPSPYLLWLQERERRKTNVLDPSHHFPSLPSRLLARIQQLTKRMEPAGEHTPLLL